MNWKTYFQGKKITVMGLGVLGRGVGDVKFLAEAGADLIVTDLKKADELQSSLGELSKFSNIKFVLGEHKLEDFRNRDFILKAAGVPRNSPYIAEALAHNIPIEMSSALFVRFTTATIVGITGTRGKSTVTHMVHEVLQLAEKDHNRKVFLGGNVKGISTLAYLPLVRKEDIVVLELDSWQLQGFGTDKISPHISVFTTFFPDHLNYYEGDMYAYLGDKANIFKYQTAQDYFVVGEQVSPILGSLEDEIKGQMYVVRGADFPRDWKLRIPGEHNRYNAAIAIKVAEIMKVPHNTIREAIENFKGVAGRLELVKTHHGISIYNDTTATTPDATLVGLEAVTKGKEPGRAILIMGGADKNLEMNKLIDALPRYCKKVVLLPGSGSEKILQKNFEGKDRIVPVHTLEEALETALAGATPGDVILFSPAFASFGMFKNEYDRGDQFVALVKKIK